MWHNKLNKIEWFRVKTPVKLLPNEKKRSSVCSCNQRKNTCCEKRGWVQSVILSRPWIHMDPEAGHGWMHSDPSARTWFCILIFSLVLYDECVEHGGWCQNLGYQWIHTWLVILCLNQTNKPLDHHHGLRVNFGDFKTDSQLAGFRSNWASTGLIFDRTHIQNVANVRSNDRIHTCKIPGRWVQTPFTVCLECLEFLFLLCNLTLYHTMFAGQEVLVSCLPKCVHANFIAPSCHFNLSM